MGCITPEGELERTRELSLSPLATPTEALLTFQRPADLDSCLDDSGHFPQS